MQVFARLENAARSTGVAPWLALAVVTPVAIGASFYQPLAEPANILLIMPLLWACFASGPRSLVLMVIMLTGLRVLLEFLHQSQAGLAIQLWPFLASSLAPAVLYVALATGALFFRMRQEQLRRQVAARERTELMGRLAGGLAHDFNNILTVVLGVVYNLRRDESLSPQVREWLDQIDSTSRRGAELVRQLMGLRESGGGAGACVSLNEFIHEAARYARPVLTGKIDLEARADPQELPVAVSRVRLHQLVLNLCINARDAMPEGGLLELSVRPAAIDDKTAEAHKVKPGPYALLCVKDTGTGMSPRTLSRLFTPFFTTKSPEQGSGLGLVVVSDIVRAAGGFIEVDSKLGEGTTFRIYLPLCPAGASQ